MSLTPQKMKEAGLEDMLACAHWLVDEFKKMELHSIAQIFQHALDDSLSWLHTMHPKSRQKLYSNDIKTKEAQIIRDILVKYASIQDPKRREKALQKMQRAASKKREAE